MVLSQSRGTTLPLPLPCFYDCLFNYYTLPHQLAHFTKYYYGGQIKADEMGRASSMHERDEKCIQNFGWKI
jgi:hypothetical protein